MKKNLFKAMILGVCVTACVETAPNEKKALLGSDSIFAQALHGSLQLSSQEASNLNLTQGDLSRQACDIEESIHYLQNNVNFVFLHVCEAEADGADFYTSKTYKMDSRVQDNFVIDVKYENDRITVLACIDNKPHYKIAVDVNPDDKKDLTAGEVTAYNMITFNDHSYYNELEFDHGEGRFYDFSLWELEVGEYKKKHRIISRLDSGVRQLYSTTKSINENDMEYDPRYLIAKHNSSYGSSIDAGVFGNLTLPANATKSDLITKFEAYSNLPITGDHYAIPGLKDVADHDMPVFQTGALKITTLPFPMTVSEMDPPNTLDALTCANAANVVQLEYEVDARSSCRQKYSYTGVSDGICNLNTISAQSRDNEYDVDLNDFEFKTLDEIAADLKP